MSKAQAQIGAVGILGLRAGEDVKCPTASIARWTNWNQAADPDAEVVIRFVIAIEGATTTSAIP